jgi:hypothetical protein
MPAVFCAIFASFAVKGFPSSVEEGRHPEVPRIHQRDEGSGVHQHLLTLREIPPSPELPRRSG